MKGQTQTTDRQWAYSRIEMYGKYGNKDRRTRDAAKHMGHKPYADVITRNTTNK